MIIWQVYLDRNALEQRLGIFSVSNANEAWMFSILFLFWFFPMLSALFVFCFISCIISCWRPKWRKELSLEKKTYNTVHSFKPWKKNFLAQCLKCESMSRPTDDQNSVRSHKWTGKHMQKLRITQNKHPISITKNFGKIS